MVAEWRRLSTPGPETGNRVHRARAEERRWELEIAMIEEFKLTLRRVHKQRVRAERLRFLRRVLTLGIWWK